MQNTGIRPSRFGIENHGFRNLQIAFWNLGQAQLLEKAIQRHEGIHANGGAFVVRTGQFTGRSPNDKFVVLDETTENEVHWGKVNQPLDEAAFYRLYTKMLAYCQGGELFVQDCFGGAHPDFAVPIRVITQRAWHSVFARQLFVRSAPEKLENHVPKFTLVFLPGFHANPEEDQTRSEAAIVVSFKKKMVLIAGTSYAGEVKKSVFTILNYLFPSRGVFPMHCSANIGADGKVALFFGLSGTGKTTLSADPTRRLIGDDEHGWSSEGVFNFEGGCYAKCIRLSREKEPQIWNAIRYGTILENVVVDPDSRRLDFDADDVTENTRAAYPVEFIDNAVVPGIGGHPTEIVFLTADAFGVLPPIARLTPEQAMYHFLSGYTAKLAGTERGLGKEPQATFSACFGEPFLPLHPMRYAEMLGERIRRHQVGCWLVNTGWAGGPFGVGQRMDLTSTRAMVDAAVEGRLDNVEVAEHPVFGVLVPRSCPGVPAEMLDARGMWADRGAYDSAARDLAARFEKNFERFGSIDPAVRGAGPRTQVAGSARG